MHSRGRRWRPRRRCMITRAAPRCQAAFCPTSQDTPMPHMTMLKCSTPVRWHDSELLLLLPSTLLLSSPGILLLILCVSPPRRCIPWNMWAEGGRRRGTGLRRRLILHRCISRLKLDNSSTRLGCRSPMSLLSLDVFSLALFRGYVNLSAVYYPPGWLLSGKSKRN